MKIREIPNKIYRRLFKDGSYGVAIRPLGSDKQFVAKYGNNKEWYADPFVCTHNGKDYLFIELMDICHVYGQIAVAPIENDKIGDFKVVISEPFHMSFPNVFQWNGTWYMLPEVYMSGEIRLYECLEFPYRWQLKKVLLDNVEMVDHALYPKENGFYMISYDIKHRDNKCNRVFDLNMQNLTIKEIKPSGDWCRERPGSTFFKKMINIIIVYRIAMKHMDIICIYGKLMNFQWKDFKKPKKEKSLSMIGTLFQANII